MERLRPYQIATLCFRTTDDQTVDVEHATDEQFQAFIERVGIRINDQGIVEWSFDDRCRAVNFARAKGKSLPFITGQNKNNSQPAEAGIVSELFERRELAS